jgi:hypothetical protein
VIVGVCADKGSPGVTTLALALGLVWAGERVVLEADPSGADLPMRIERLGRGPLHPEPSVLSLAADARMGLPPGALPRYAQHTAVGVPVIPGALSAEAFLPMRALWSSVAREAAGWAGTVIADLGRLQPGHAALPIVQAADAVVLLARPTVDGLYHLRDRVTELTHLLENPGRGHLARQGTRVMVAVLVGPRQEREALAEVRMMLEAIGSPAHSTAVSVDPRMVQVLLGARLDRRAVKTPLLSSVTALAEGLVHAFPQLSRPLPADPHHGGGPPGLPASPMGARP